MRKFILEIDMEDMCMSCPKDVARALMHISFSLSKQSNQSSGPYTSDSGLVVGIWRFTNE